MTFSIPTVLVLKIKVKNNNSNTKYAYGGIMEKILIFVFVVKLLPFFFIRGLSLYF